MTATRELAERRAPNSVQVLTGRDAWAQMGPFFAGIQARVWRLWALLVAAAGIVVLAGRLNGLSWPWAAALALVPPVTAAATSAWSLSRHVWWVLEDNRGRCALAIGCAGQNAYVSFLGVDRKRQGLATDMGRELLEWADHYGVTLTQNPGSTGLRRTYEAAGFHAPRWAPSWLPWIRMIRTPFPRGQVDSHR